MATDESMRSLASAFVFAVLVLARAAQCRSFGTNVPSGSVMSSTG